MKNIKNPIKINKPNIQFLLQSTKTNEALCSKGSPTNVCGNKCKKTSPNKPPMAKLTNKDKDETLILAGIKASMKFGGPEIYVVAKSELPAGPNGNNLAKRYSIIERNPPSSP
ncbi:unnamed protein product [[Candida] boidinii]|nr:unnamed protein product [[Candida] boidinii]